MAIDLLVREGGTGGDLVLDGGDLVAVYGKENQPYLAQFSGSGNWWGNFLLVGDEPVIRFSSKTEQALRENELNSSGRTNIENAMLADLQYLQDTVAGTTVAVSVTIVSAERLDAVITINGQQFYMQWNPYSGFLKYSI